MSHQLAFGLLLSLATTGTGCGALNKFRGKSENQSSVSDSAGQNKDLAPISPVFDPLAPVPIDIGAKDPAGGAVAVDPGLDKTEAADPAQQPTTSPVQDEEPAPLKKVDPVEFVFVLDESMRDGKVAAAEVAISRAIRQLTKTKPEAVGKIFLISDQSILLPSDSRIVQIFRYVNGDNALAKLAALAVGLYSVGGKKVKTDPLLKKHIVLISDGDAEGGVSDDELDAPAFKDLWTERKLGPMSFHSIVGVSYSRNHHDCDIDDIGKEYMQLSDDDEFKGEIRDICRGEISTSLDEIMNPLLKALAPKS